MAKNRTDKSRYPSNYGGGWVSAAQYVTECLCVLIAKQEKKELQDKFWNKEPWNKIFRRQVPLAIKLLEEYHPEVVLSVLRDKKCRKIRSFGARYILDSLLKEKQREYDAKLAQQSGKTKEKTPTTQKPRKNSNNKKSLHARLRDI